MTGFIFVDESISEIYLLYSGTFVSFPCVGTYLQADGTYIYAYILASDIYRPRLAIHYPTDLTKRYTYDKVLLDY